MNRKILAIDDELDTLAFYSEVLEDNDFITVTAQDGEEGLKKARQEKPSLIILDIMMPKKSGMKTYKELRTDPELKDIPVMIITGISKEVDFKSLLDRATTGNVSPEAHLVKPLKADELIAAIHDVIG